jgi:hypothetical protein
MGMIMGANDFHMEGGGSRVNNEQGEGKGKDSLTPTRHGSRSLQMSVRNASRARPLCPRQTTRSSLSVALSRCQVTVLSVGAAQTIFARWFWRATHSLKPMAAGAKLIQRHLPNVLTYLQHRLTNAGLEAVNATIQWVKQTARGFWNVEHFKMAIYIHCGGVGLYPHESR